MHGDAFVFIIDRGEEVTHIEQVLGEHFIQAVSGVFSSAPAKYGFGWGHGAKVRNGERGTGNGERGTGSGERVGKK